MQDSGNGMAQGLFDVLVPRPKTLEEEVRLTHFLYLIYAFQLVCWVIIPATVPTAATIQVGAAHLVHGLLGLWLIRRNQLTFPRVSVPVVWLAGLVMIAVAGGGIHDIGVMAFPLTILAAAFLLGRWGALLTFAAAALAIGALIYLETSGIVTTPYADRTDAMDFVTATIILGANFGVLWVLMGSMQDDLRRARAGEQSARQANEDAARQREALADSERRYRLLAENARDVVQVFGLDLRCKYVSPSITAQRGFTVEEFLNSSATELVTPESFELIARTLAEVLQDEASGVRDPDQSRRFELNVYRKDGSLMWVESVYTAIRNEAGEIVEFLGVTRNIDERKAAEAERSALEALMQDMQRSESLGLLAGGIAHDFNNLLSGIIGNADLALARMPEDAVGRAEVGKVMRIAEDAADLSRQLLAYSGKGKFSVRTVDLSAIARDMMRVLNVTAGRHIQIELELAENLPAVEVDVTQIRQVIMNLIINAADAMEGRTGSVSIRTGTKRHAETDVGHMAVSSAMKPGEYAYLEVTDTGAGMTESVKARIFEPFFTTKPDGHGLGLAAALGIVRAHGGAVSVYSEPGAGTTMRVYLPVASRTVTPLQEAAPSDPGYFASGTVLIVDDEPTVSSMARAVLAQRGFEVLTAGNGLEAIERFRERSGEIRLVLLDLTMPVMSGHEAMEEIRAIDPDVPIILTSGFSEQHASAKQAGNGYTAFLQKPYRITDLDGVVRAALSL